MKAVNLLPPDLRGAPRRAKGTGAPAPDAPGGSGPYVVLGALALCVVALVGYVLATNTVKEREVQLASVTAQHAAAAKQAAALKPYATFQDLATKRVQTVTALAGMRFDWERALGDVSRALPGEVTLESLNGTVSAASGGGGLRGSVAAPAIEISGCTPRQDDVAALLSRLRTVRGVTRVSLAKSASADGAATSAPSTGPDGKPQGPPCGKASAPRFDLIVFFERSAATATAPDPAAAATESAAAATGAPAGSAGSGTAPAGTTTPPATATPAPAGQSATTATATTASTTQGTPAP